MPSSIWTEEHVNFLERLIREQDIGAQESAARMSRHFGHRVTPSQVNALLHRMRKPTDPFYRDIPYRRRGARYVGS